MKKGEREKLFKHFPAHSSLYKETFIEYPYFRGFRLSTSVVLGLRLPSFGLTYRPVIELRVFVPEDLFPLDAILITPFPFFKKPELISGDRTDGAIKGIYAVSTSFLKTAFTIPCIEKSLWRIIGLLSGFVD